MADAIRFVLKDHGHRAGAFTVGYRSCDDSTAQSGDTERRKCAANANAYAQAANVVALIGPYYSCCAQVEIPILNRAPGGPLAMVSSSNCITSLTRGGRLALPPPLGVSGEPEAYYPTGQRNYMRVNAREDVEAVAAAMLAKRLGLDSVYLVYGDDEAGTSYGPSPLRVRPPAWGSRSPAPGATTTTPTSALSQARSRARALTACSSAASRDGRLLKPLRARLGKDATIIGAAPFSEIPGLIETAAEPPAGHTSPRPGCRPTDPASRPRPSASLASSGPRPGGYALQTAQATEVVLQAIERSDGTRASVLRELHATRIRDGLLGSFGFDRHGDMTPRQGRDPAGHRHHAGGPAAPRPVRGRRSWTAS